MNNIKEKELRKTFNLSLTCFYLTRINLILHLYIPVNFFLFFCMIGLIKAIKVKKPIYVEALESCPNLIYYFFIFFTFLFLD